MSYEGGHDNEREEKRSEDLNTHEVIRKREDSKGEQLNRTGPTKQGKQNRTRIAKIRQAMTDRNINENIHHRWEQSDMNTQIPRQGN